MNMEITMSMSYVKVVSEIHTIKVDSEKVILRLST